MEPSQDFLNAYQLGKNHGKPHWLKPEDDVVDKAEPYCILLDEKGEEHVESLQHLCPRPSRQKGEYCMGDIDSFIKFTLSNRDDDQTVVWCNEFMFPAGTEDENKAFLCSVFNDNTGKTPGWCDFYCWMVTESETETEEAMTKIIREVKNMQIYKGMPDIALPKTIIDKLITGGT